MRIVVVDIGNTKQKAAVYEEARMLEFFSSDNIPVSLLKEWKQKYRLEYLMYSSVAQYDASFIEDLGSIFKVYTLQDLPLPFKMEYLTPESLGSDRIACMIAAAELYPQQTVLVVQCGSCMTFDLLHNNVYQGGSISPGLNMRFKALADFTARLPLCSVDDKIPFVGSSTTSCIQAGVWHGYISECASMIEKYLAHYKDVKVILTGGDAEKLKDKLKITIFAHPNLVLYGLYIILNKYVENK